jgi:Sulfotransferase family
MRRVESGKPPIFVIGSGRSGTTLLRNMLNAHPAIYIAFEPHFYWYESMYRTRATGRVFLDYYFQTSHFRRQHVDPARVLAGLPDPLPRSALGLAYAAVMREKAAQFGRTRFGEKTPAHVTLLNRIYRDFPDARVVHIVRDPRNTVVSLSRMPWAPGSTMINAGYLDTEHKHATRFRDRMLRIRLEDLLAEPRATMQSVLAYVGEPWHDAVLDHARNLPANDDTPTYPWLDGATRDRVPAQAQWQALRPVQIRMIEQMTKRMMADNSYERATLDREPSWFSVFWEGVRQIPQVVRFYAITIPLALKARDPRHIDESEAAFYRRINPAAWTRYPNYELPPPPALKALR